MQSLNRVHDFSARNVSLQRMIMASQNARVGFFLLALFSFFSAARARAKIATDFDPHLDFSQLKTFAFIGGVEQLVRMPLNPDLLNNRIHRSVTRELTAKGLREVQPEENPDLVVRYWASSQKDVDVATSTNWGSTALTSAITGDLSTILWRVLPPTRAHSALN